MVYVSPKKNLGQHFLADPNIARKILGYLKMESTRQVIEIGPGTGILTDLLLQQKGLSCVFIEFDRESVDYLRKKFPEASDQIVHEDFLRFNIKDYFQNKVSLVGNLPYNISSQIFFKVLEHTDQVEEMVCMIQREVAQRITAVPGSKTYGILSVLLQAFYHIDYLFTVKPGVFIPPPKVHSAVIRLKRNETKELGCNRKLFFKVVKMAFNQRRKTLRNSLKAMITDKEDLPAKFTRRPEQLNVQEFVYLTNWLSSQ